MDLALKAIIIEAVDKVYLEEKIDRYTVFFKVTAQDMIKHSLQH